MLDVAAPPFRQGNGFVTGDEAMDGDVTVGMVGTTAVVPMKPTLGDTVSVGTAAIELTPRFPISVDPNGMPVGDTAEPVPNPIGEVAPRLGVGLAMPLTCAIAALQITSAGIAKINDHLIGKRARIELLRRIWP